MLLRKLARWFMSAVHPLGKQALVYVVAPCCATLRHAKPRLMLPLVLPLACASPLEPVAPSAEGIALALACGEAHGLTVKHPLETLRFYLRPDLGDSAGHQLAEVGKGTQGWIRTSLSQEPRVWAHLSLHLLYGLPGYGTTGHPKVFAGCGLYPL